MWDIIFGSLLDTLEVAAQAGHLKSAENEEIGGAVTDLCTIPDCTLIAAAIQNLQGIMLLSCNLSSRTLSIVKVVSIAGESFIPTSLSSSFTGGLLWMVTGVSKLPGSTHPSFSCVKVISGFKESAASTDHKLVVLGDNELLGGTKLLEKLQGVVSIDEKVFLAAAEAVKKSMSNLLIKKQYTEENREYRKRTINDKKVKK